MTAPLKKIRYEDSKNAKIIKNFQQEVGSTALVLKISAFKGNFSGSVTPKIWILLLIKCKIASPNFPATNIAPPLIIS